MERFNLWYGWVMSDLHEWQRGKTLGFGKKRNGV